MPEVRDHLDRVVTVPERPQRIVCLCPSLTETLFDLGLAGRIVGRTDYCVHPASLVPLVPAVGGTKTPNLRKIAALQPDLVIVEKEENPRKVVDALAEDWPVYVVDVESINDALRAVRDLGEITGTVESARELVEKIETALATVRPLDPPRRALYLIWHQPWMAAGPRTFIDAMLARCGLENVCTGFDERYPKLTEAALVDLHPDVVLLSSEPFSFTEAHAAAVRTLLPCVYVTSADGQAFSWYGSRMVQAPIELNRVLDHVRDFDLNLRPSPGGGEEGEA